MDHYLNSMVSMKSILTTAASLAASAMLVRSIVNDFLPSDLQDLLSSRIHRVLNRFSSQFTMVFEEYQGFSLNQIYEAADIYLGAKISPSTRRLRVSKAEKDKTLNIVMERNEEIIDIFQGMQLKWKFICREGQNAVCHLNPNSLVRSELRSFELSFHKKHKDRVLGSYLPFLLNKSKEMREEKKTLKLFTVDFDNMYGNFKDAWSPINLDHPASFDALAMDFELKRMLMEDLDMFVKRKDFYRRVGKAWKRGYLLHGPPGTGKSSLIAAIANYLKFDIYDLELTEIQRNSDLRKLLVATANRSILIVEDIDCTIELQERTAGNVDNGNRQQNRVTLSGLLNFLDGLWSSCGDERIIIFTTNHKDRLDPALLRPGRMDMHIRMSYCTPCGFKILTSNYLTINDHPLFEKIQNLIEEVKVTPAQVAEELMRSNDPEVVLRSLLKFLQEKQVEGETTTAEGETRIDEQDQGQERVEHDDNQNRKTSAIAGGA